MLNSTRLPGSNLLTDENENPGTLNYAHTKQSLQRTSVYNEPISSSRLEVQRRVK